MASQPANLGLSQIANSFAKTSLFIKTQYSKSLLHVFLYPFLDVQILEKSSLNLKIKITGKSTCMHIVNNIRKHKFNPPPNNI